MSIWSGEGFSTNSRTALSSSQAHEAVGARVVDRHERERADRAGRLVLGDLRGEVDVGEHVAVEHQEALVEQRTRRTSARRAVPRGSGSST